MNGHQAFLGLLVFLVFCGSKTGAQQSGGLLGALTNPGANSGGLLRETLEKGSLLVADAALKTGSVGLGVADLAGNLASGAVNAGTGLVKTGVKAGSLITADAALKVGSVAGGLANAGVGLADQGLHSIF